MEFFPIGILSHSSLRKLARIQRGFLLANLRKLYQKKRDGDADLAGIAFDSRFFGYSS